MSVYPLVISIGRFEITGYGLMVMVGFFVAGWAMGQELRRRGFSDVFAWDIVMAGVIGGIVGAKLWYAGLHGAQTLFSRSGMVWYGGFLGGVAAVMAIGRWRGVPLRFQMDLTAPALAVGYALGRVGCFLVQDDYGRPTDVPWGLRFPEGLPPSTGQMLARWGVDLPPGTQPTDVLAVHPTQLYEVAAMLFVFWLLWRLRNHRHATGWLFGLYLTLAGLERFLVEFVRAKDDRMIGSFTLAQVTSVGLILVGAFLLWRWWEDDGFRVEPAPGVLRKEGGSGKREE